MDETYRMLGKEHEADLEREAEIRNENQLTKCGWSPWHGERLFGWPIRTWVMGHEVYRDGQFNSERMGQEAIFDHARGGYWATAVDT